MQVTKTLFQTKILHNAIRNFAFPDDLLKRHEILQSWIETLKMGTLEKVKETSLQGDFLKDIFQDILGYRSVISGEGKPGKFTPNKRFLMGVGLRMVR